MWPANLPKDPTAAQEILTKSLAEILRPILRDFDKPYQMAFVQYMPINGDNGRSKGLTNIAVTIGWYHCTAGDGKSMHRILKSYGFSDYGVPDDAIIEASNSSVSIQYGPLGDSENCYAYINTPEFKVDLPGPGSRSVLDQYLGKYKDVHADPHYSIDSKPPHSPSYYGVARG